MSPYLIEEDEGVRNLVRRIRRVAVLGIKTEAQASQPAFYVAESLFRAGLEVIPVPVYYPEVTQILGQPVFRKLADIPGPVDCVDVFRRPEHLESHLEDILKKRPYSVWLQLGISHPPFAKRLTDEGIFVVQNRCLLVEYRDFTA